MAWVSAICLVVLGIATYLLYPSDKTWWIGSFLLVPFVWLIVGRGERKGIRPEESQSSGDDSGPWAPP
jgi:apolipoprotein N-acyltransferase